MKNSFSRTLLGVIVIISTMAFITDNKIISSRGVPISSECNDENCMDDACLAPMTDRDVLIDLYRSTDGDHWTHRWDTTTSDFCNWYGVYCNGNGRVVSLELFKNKLVGFLEESIGALLNLDQLNVSINKLSDRIPISVGNLSNLSVLNLFRNEFSGSLPSEISHLNNLRVITVAQNNLTGSIPIEIGMLNNLKELLLSQNSFSGPIPNEIGNMTHLERLLLSENRLTGAIPNSLSRLINLKHLHLFSNQLTGTIPAGLGLLLNLRAITLNNNRMVGCFPNSLHSLCNQLTTYDFSQNSGLPGGGDFASFCSNNTGACLCDNAHQESSLDCGNCANTVLTHN